MPNESKNGEIIEHAFQKIKEFGGERAEFAVENVIDICAIINSDLRLEMRESDEGMVESLVKKSILTEEISDKIRRMKRFRNILVHRYGKIDDRVAFSILRDNIDHFDKRIVLSDMGLQGLLGR